MKTALTPEEELAAIVLRIRTKNQNREAYLEWRKVKKAFYMGGREAIEAHFATETLVHAKQLFDEQEIERAKQATEVKEAEALLIEKKQLADEIRREVDGGYTYFEFDETRRGEIEELDQWIKNVPGSRWTLWHLETARFLEDIDHRSETISITQSRIKNVAPVLQWEYLTVSAKIKGASTGVLSAFMNQGLEDEALNRLQVLGDQGWEVVGTAPVVYGAMGSVSTSTLVIMLKRPKAG